MEEDKKHKWLKVLGIILMTFIVSFFAFYTALAVTISRFMDPVHNMKKFEKMIDRQDRDFRKFEEKMIEHPFVPKMRPMLVNLVKEDNKYLVIVDLKPLEGNEKGVNVEINDKVIKVSGALEKNTHHGESILNFSQAYYLDEDILKDKITKEKKGDKYIITVPFKD